MYELIVNKDKLKAVVIKELVYKAIKTYTSKKMVKYEKKLIKIVDKKVNQ